MHGVGRGRLACVFSNFARQPNSWLSAPLTPLPLPPLHLSFISGFCLPACSRRTPWSHAEMVASPVGMFLFRRRVRFLPFHRTASCSRGRFPLRKLAISRAGVRSMIWRPAGIESGRYMSWPRNEEARLFQPLRNTASAQNFS